MEKKNASSSSYIWWAAASGVQIVWGIYSLRKGYSGDSSLMPLKAFGVASLFVGATATATIGTFSASGIHSAAYVSKDLSVANSSDVPISPSLAILPEKTLQPSFLINNQTASDPNQHSRTWCRSCAQMDIY